jgi:hypothetical protein
MAEELDLSRFKPIGWYASGQTEITDDEVVVTYDIGGTFKEKEA